MEWGEPIPDFKTRYEGRLESCLSAPFQSFAGRDLYPTIEHKAAMLFYLLIKNHPFQNGNKRIAVTSLITFLALNKKWLKVPPNILYNSAMMVAESKPSDRPNFLEALRVGVQEFSVGLASVFRKTKKASG